MKNALIRILTLATLASSLSGLASAGESKHNNAASQQSGCATQEDKKQKKEKKMQQDETQQEKDFEHMLMGIYG